MSEEERKFLEIVDLKKGFGSGETRQEVLKAAINSGETVPEIVVCNVDWDAMEKDGLKDGQKQLIGSHFPTPVLILCH